MLNNALQVNQDLVLFIDQFQIMRIAKEDVKLAESLYRQGQKKMLLHRASEAAQNQDATFKAQIESNKASEAGKQRTEQVKGEIDLEKARFDGETSNKNAVVAMVTSLLSKGEPIPANLQPLVNVVVENIMIPLAASNEMQKQEMIQQMRDSQQQQQVPQEQVEGGEPQMQQEPQLQETV